VETTEEEPRENLREHLDDELTRQLQTTVRYAMKQGFDETTIRRTVEAVLNEARSAR
jgi:hypothetical protein